MSNSSPNRTRLGAAAGLLGASAALIALTGAGPVPSIVQLTGAVEDVGGNCDEAEHAADPACAGASSAADTTSSTTDPTSSRPASAPLAAETRTFQAGAAGSAEVTVDSSELRLLAAHPNAGWSTDVEQAIGREIEVTFRSGSLRVDLHLELEDGQVRERVRTRDDATDVRTETTNGVVTDDDGIDDHSSDDSIVDDHSSDDSIIDDHSSDDSIIDDDSADDDSGPGSDGDDDSGPGSDDDGSDDSGHGSDDGPGHD